MNMSSYIIQHHRPCAQPGVSISAQASAEATVRQDALTLEAKLLLLDVALASNSGVSAAQAAVASAASAFDIDYLAHAALAGVGLSAANLALLSDQR